VNQLLRFLLLRCSFLWDDGDYRIVDSHGASITVASADVRLRFTCRGAGVAIDVEPVRSGPVSSRFSLSRLCALLGRFDGGDDADLLRASLADIEAFFRGELAADFRGNRRDVCLVR
jgi:hypothetical protein